MGKTRAVSFSKCVVFIYFDKHNLALIIHHMVQNILQNISQRDENLNLQRQVLLACITMLHAGSQQCRSSSPREGGFTWPSPCDHHRSDHRPDFFHASALLQPVLWIAANVTNYNKSYLNALHKFSTWDKVAPTGDMSGCWAQGPTLREAVAGHVEPSSNRK